MKILLIEDDPIKASSIKDYIENLNTKNKVDIRGSYKGGIDYIFNQPFDCILLDMSIPTYDSEQNNFSGKPRNYGGKDILKEMKRYKRKGLVKVITQYNEFDGGSVSMKELDAELKSKYSSIYKGFIIYSIKKNDWKAELELFLNTL